VLGERRKVPDDPLRIRGLSKLTGVSIDAIRYFERRGVLPRATRTESNYRPFPLGR
jgi:DNA-binding transcriptional MerR regulator